MIVTPCPVCQMNVEDIKTILMPVVHYSTLMSVADGKNRKEAGLDG